MPPPAARPTAKLLLLRFLASPSRSVAAVTASLALAILGSFGYSAYHEYNAALARAERETRNVTAVLAQHTARAFDGIRESLNAVTRIHADVAADAYSDRRTVHGLLKAAQDGSPVIRSLGWIDAAGNRVASSLGVDLPAVSALGQEHFEVHRDDPNRGFHISAPIQSRITGDWIVNASLRLNDAQGRFVGVAGAIINPGYFAEVYRAVDLGPQRNVLLLRDDGSIMSREPDAPAWRGKSLAGTSIFRDHVHPFQSGSLHVRSTIDDVDRIVSFAKVAGAPLRVVVGMSRAAALAPFYEDVRAEGYRVGALLIVLVLGSWLLTGQLRRREENERASRLLASVVESTDDAIFTAALDGVITSWNDGAARVFGYTAEEAIGRNISTIVPAGRENEPAIVAGNISLGSRVSNFETQRRHRSGRLIDIVLTASPLRDGAGAVVGASLIARDVTDLKQASLELRASEERFGLLYKQIPVMMHSIDHEGRLLSVSDYWLESLGYSRDEVIGRLSSDFMTAESRQYAREVVLPAFFRTGSCKDVSYRFLKKDGTIVDVLLSATGERDAQGKVVRSLTVLIDITELKRREAELRNAEARASQAHARLVDAIDSLADGFLLWDADDRLVLRNASIESTDAEKGRLLVPGVRFEDVMAERIRLGRVIGARGREEDYIRERVAQHRNPTGEAIEQQFDNGRWISLRERRTRDGAIVSIRTDITELKRREAELIAARADAVAANQAKSEFLSRMSHELRTPLNAIIGFAQMLELDRHRNLSSEQREFCNFIISGGKHLLSLVNEVLDLARIEAGTLKYSLERVVVATSLAEVSHTMMPMAGKAEIELVVDQTPDIPDVRADELRLRQILINLVSNAIKYNRPGGSVRLSAAHTDRGRVRFEVADTGIGISAEQQADLFQPFQRLGAEYTTVEGTGIGLAICKRLIEAMGGTIGFMSTQAKGSTFWIELPVESSWQVREVAGDLMQEVAPRATAGGYTLLYVEDNPANLRLMEHLMAGLPNVSMLSAPTPQLGLDLALAHRPDVIVLDLNLPGMSGYEVLTRLKAAPEMRHIPVMALTAAALPRDIERGLAAGFFRYLTKPLDIKAFLATLDEVLAGLGGGAAGREATPPG